MSNGVASPGEMPASATFSRRGCLGAAELAGESRGWEGGTKWGGGKGPLCMSTPAVKEFSRHHWAQGSLLDKRTLNSESGGSGFKSQHSRILAVWLWAKQQPAEFQFPDFKMEIWLCSSTDYCKILLTPAFPCTPLQRRGEPFKTQIMTLLPFTPQWLPFLWESQSLWWPKMPPSFLSLLWPHLPLSLFYSASSAPPCGSVPLHWLFPLPGTPFAQILAWLTPSSPSSVFFN